MPAAKALANGQWQRAAILRHLASVPPDAAIRQIVADPIVEQRLAAFEAADDEALASQARYRKWARRGLRATTFGILIGALLLLPLDHIFVAPFRRFIGALQTLALLTTVSAALLTLWLKPLDHWVKFRASAEALRGRVFRTIMTLPAPPGSDPAQVATDRLNLLMAAHVTDQLDFFRKRAKEHGRIASKFSPLRIAGYLMIIVASTLGAAAALHSLGLALPPTMARLVEALVLPDANRWQLGITTMASGVLAHATARVLMEEDERKAALYALTADKLQSLIDEDLPATKADCAIGDETRLRTFFAACRHIMDQEHAVWTFMRPKSQGLDEAD